MTGPDNRHKELKIEIVRHLNERRAAMTPPKESFEFNPDNYLDENQDKELLAALIELCNWENQQLAALIGRNEDLNNEVINERIRSAYESDKHQRDLRTMVQ